MTDKTRKTGQTRRGVLKGLAAGGATLGAAQALPGWVPYIQAQTAEPIRIGFQVHRTGIGATYGRWYDRVTTAATRIINEGGGINGRPVEIVAEDDATDPKRGAEVVEKLATQHNCDVAYGTLFSHVVIGSAPRAAELELPYFVVSEGTHVASGALNRWTLQPGITDVKAQVLSMAPFITGELGKKVTMIYPDYAFGYNHRDNLPDAIAAQGGEVIEQIAIPPTETSFFKYFPRIPSDTEVIYHVMVGPAVLTFVKEMGDFYGSGDRPQVFGFIDSLEGVSIDAPGLDFLEGTYFWEGMPRYQQPDAAEWETFYRDAVGVDGTGAATGDADDVSTFGHMFGCWETLHVIKRGMEAANYQGPQDRKALVEAVEAIGEMAEGREHPQGPKRFNGKTHQVFGPQFISRVEEGRLTVVRETDIEAGMYEDMVDYTTRAF
ncbi:MAG TPA: ABC transporter substrate-binding protein [Thermohalobaculum sp.]|nr:ABC transporter substrate-binding protein [Thermohalobaculum sp.]